MLTHLGIIIVLSIANGFFALSEMTVIASRKGRLKPMAKHSRRAQLVLDLAHHPERFLSSIQIGITVIMLLTGAVAGATLRTSIAHQLEQLNLPWLATYASSIGTVLGFFLATLIQIVIGELVPKRIALAAPEKLATYIVIPMLAIARLCHPFVWLLNTTSSLILRILYIRSSSRDIVTEEEIRMLVAEGTEQGVLDDDERNMVNRVLHLGDRTVGSLMTPRTRITWLDYDAPLENNLDTLRHTVFSCYPVYRGDESDILGIVEIKRVIDALLDGKHDLFANMEKPLYIPSTVRALDLMSAFRENSASAALVVDEYGDIEGLMTLNDLLGSVISQSSSTTQKDAPIHEETDTGGKVLDGSVSVDDLREILEMDLLPYEDEHEFNTLGGMMIASFGYIPKAGETFAWHGLNFEVAKLDGPRIDKVRIYPTVTSSTQDDF